MYFSLLDRGCRDPSHSYWDHLWELNCFLFLFFLESFICTTILKSISLNPPPPHTHFFLDLESTSGLVIPARIPKKSENNFFFFTTVAGLRRRAGWLFEDTLLLLLLPMRLKPPNSNNCDDVLHFLQLHLLVILNGSERVSSSLRQTR